ncbi:MAG: signal peptide peptidase SppA [Alphaproteobacteria bacterium]|nr:signal peptide peptidase SppA [Alphaproteobacteria bacterium]
MRRIGKIILWLLASVGAAGVISLIFAAVFVSRIGDSAPDLPDRMVLSLDLNAGVTEQSTENAFELFQGDGRIEIRKLADTLEKASKDDRVEGVVVRLGTARLSVAQAQEVRTVVKRFRKSGKFALAYADSFGQVSNSTIEYYVASAFDEVWMQPSGELAITGLMLEMPFVGDALNSIGVKAKIRQRREYKSAPDTFTRNSLSKPARKNLQQLVDSLFNQIVAGIAESRKLPTQQVRDLIDNSPLLSAQAQSAKLIDRLDYWPQFVEAAKVHSGKKSSLIKLRRYSADGDLPNRSGPKVALIYGVGAIVSGKKKSSPFDSGSYVAASQMARAIDAAAKDDTVKAILLRIDSPGGSYLASDTIWNAVRRANAKGKPIIASMGAIAASGGYYIAMAADKVIAQPGTITGSIGVYGGKFVSEGLWSKLGINWQGVHAGRNATMWSGVRDYPPGAEARLDAIMDAIYADFTTKAAKARSLSTKRIDAAARGRVFSGVDALAAGLVDKLGGFDTALATVKQAIGLKPDQSITLVRMPKRLPIMQRLLKLVTGESDGVKSTFADILGLEDLIGDGVRRQIGPIARDLEFLRPPVGRLQMPPIRFQY